MYNLRGKSLLQAVFFFTFASTPQLIFFLKKIFFALIVSLCFFSSCKVYRFFVRNFANITDYKFFAEHPLAHSTQPFHFFSSNNLNTPGKFLVKGFEDDTASLDNILEASSTVAFLIIRHDTILYEKYFDRYTDSSWVASFSMAKSYVSALIGIAIHEGLIKSVDEPITNYIPEMKDSSFKKVTIRHLLQMTSGIKFSEGYYSPFSDAAKFYYGTNLRKSIENMKVEYEPGTKFEYKSGNSQLLGLIVERATKKTVTQYMQEKIWQPIGTEFNAS
ncbi:MAG: serine hydrolase domain-containing protein, partial [Bacteroidota bacterium]